MNKLTKNYHTHTYRCGHASGTDEEYVLAAMKLGIKVLGFTDHVFLPGVRAKGMRGDFEELNDYLSSIGALQKKYPQIKILKGFECEYSPFFTDYYRELLESGKVDYLIQGQHNFFDKRHNQHWYAEIYDNDMALELYTKDVISGIKSGLFSYLAHPDVMVAYFERWDERTIRASRRICLAAKKYGVPLEFNLGQSRVHHRNFPGEKPEFMYPYPAFWEIAKEVGNEVIIGVDAHNPKNFEETNYEWAFAFLDKIGITPIEEIKFYEKDKKI